MRWLIDFAGSGPILRHASPLLARDSWRGREPCGRYLSAHLSYGVAPVRLAPSRSAKPIAEGGP
jgi:hypothetical protein